MDSNPARTFRLHLRGRCPTCEQTIPTEPDDFCHYPAKITAHRHLGPSGPDDGGCMACDECDGDADHAGPHDCGHTRKPAQ